MTMRVPCFCKVSMPKMILYVFPDEAGVSFRYKSCHDLVLSRFCVGDYLVMPCIVVALPFVQWCLWNYCLIEAFGNPMPDLVETLVTCRGTVSPNIHGQSYGAQACTKVSGLSLI